MILAILARIYPKRTRTGRFYKSLSCFFPVIKIDAKGKQKKIYPCIMKFEWRPLKFHESPFTGLTAVTYKESQF